MLTNRLFFSAAAVNDYKFQKLNLCQKYEENASKVTKNEYKLLQHVLNIQFVAVVNCSKHCSKS